LVDAVSPERNDGLGRNAKLATEVQFLAAPINMGGPSGDERDKGYFLFVCRNRDPTPPIFRTSDTRAVATVKRTSFIISPSPPLGHSIAGLLPAKEHR
jgi:hypothetical protein